MSNYGKHWRTGFHSPLGRLFMAVLVLDIRPLGFSLAYSVATISRPLQKQASVGGESSQSRAFPVHTGVGAFPPKQAHFSGGQAFAVSPAFRQDGHAGILRGSCTYLEQAKDCGRLPCFSACMIQGGTMQAVYPPDPAVLKQALPTVTVRQRVNQRVKLGFGGLSDPCGLPGNW